MPRIPPRLQVRGILAGSVRRRLEKSRQRFLQQVRTSCVETQHQTLAGLLRLNSGTQFATDFGLKPNSSLSEFRRQVPVSDYSLVAPYIDRMKEGDHRALLGENNRLLMYAVTSGTTAESKLIPVTDRFVSDYRRGWQHWGIGAHQQHPSMAYLNMVQLTSSHRRFETNDGTPCGNISGLVAAMQKRFVRSMYSVPGAVAHVKDPLAKRYLSVMFALADPSVGTLVTANPSTLLQMAQFANRNSESLIRDLHNGTLSDIRLTDSERLVLRPFIKKRRRRSQQLQSILNEFGSLDPRQCWPLLVVLGVWSGGSAAAYRTELRSVFGDASVRDHGLHASEGRMTLPIEDESAAGVLDITSHFFEFIPAEQEQSTDPGVLEAHELQTGKEYFILLTTSSGLYRYNIRDVVRCVDFYGPTPMLEFLHKGAHISSITGEKIAESQVVKAVTTASHQVAVSLRQFTLTPEWGDPPGYVLFVQNDGGDSDSKPLSADFARAIDDALRRENCEYDEKRGTARLQPVRIESLSEDVWVKFSGSRMQRGGGSPEQYKHPCLLPDPEFKSLFLQACGAKES